jgi:hypothetical protein
MVVRKVDTKTRKRACEFETIEGLLFRLKGQFTQDTTVVDDGTPKPSQVVEFPKVEADLAELTVFTQLVALHNGALGYLEEDMAFMKPGELRYGIGLRETGIKKGYWLLEVDSLWRPQHYAVRPSSFDEVSENFDLSYYPVAALMEGLVRKAFSKERLQPFVGDVRCEADAAQAYVAGLLNAYVEIERSFSRLYSHYEPTDKENPDNLAKGYHGFAMCYADGSQLYFTTEGISQTEPEWWVDALEQLFVLPEGV